ncbi:MAG: divalent-cation tolerance protein CutA [Sulfuritalea sp.]|jgi:periplasmic divalent cation tolerance protein|nr:divalent-cation tolerance protein CutA [Sulfuritalea sp.]
METPQTGARTLLILTNLPDEASAQALATTLVSARLAACVNMLAPCRSVYRWQDAIESAQEIPLLIKATETGYAALEAAIRAAHPYELPEIIAVPIAYGLPEYLDWVVAETRTETCSESPNGKLPT